MNGMVCTVQKQLAMKFHKSNDQTDKLVSLLHIDTVGAQTLSTAIK